MRLAIALFLACLPSACGPVPDVETTTPQSARGAGWFGTVFSSSESPPELTALTLAFPETAFSVIDHLYYPDKARDSRVPSNGYVVLSRQNDSGTTVGKPLVFPLNASPQDLEQARKETDKPALLARWFGNIPTQGTGETAKTSGSRLLESLAAHDIVVVDKDGPVDLILILGPTSDLTKDEETTIRTHLGRGGPVLVALEPESPGIGKTRLANLLNDLGAEMKTGVVACETDQVWERLGTPSPGDQYNHAASRFLPHDAIPTLSDPQFQNISVVFSRAALLQPRRHGSASAVPTVMSHQSAWAETNNDGILNSEESQGSMPLVLASKGGVGRPGRALIYADSTALSDRWAMHPGNKILIADGLNWLLPIQRVAEKERLEAFPEAITPVQVFKNQGPLKEILLLQGKGSLRLEQRRDLFGDFSWVERESDAQAKQSYKGNALVDGLWPKLAPLHALRVWPKASSERLSALGVRNNSPVLKLIEIGGQVRELHLGGKPFNGKGQYAWEPKTDRAMLLNNSDLEPFLVPPEQLEDFGLLPNTPMDRMELEEGATRYRIEQKGEKWSLTGQSSSTPQTIHQAARKLAETLASLRVMAPAELGPSQRSPTPTLSVVFYPQKGSPIPIGIAQHEGIWVAESDHSRIWVLISPEAASQIMEHAQVLRNQ
jgi:hypothetical protein